MKFNKLHFIKIKTKWSVLYLKKPLKQIKKPNKKTTKTAYFQRLHKFQGMLQVDYISYF